jgi:hypothetical protein
MKTEALTCPNCGANLEVRGNTDHVRCSYCGANVILEKLGTEIDQSTLNEDVENGLELIGAVRYDEADEHFANCCKKYRTIPIVYFWKGITAFLNHNSEEAIFYLDKFPPDIINYNIYLSQAKRILGKSPFKISEVEYLWSWESVGVLLEAVLIVYLKEKESVAIVYKEIEWKIYNQWAGYDNYSNYIARKRKIPDDGNCSIQSVNRASSYLEHAFNLISNNQSNLEIQKLIKDIAYGFLRLALAYYILDSASDGKKMVDRALAVSPCDSFGPWVDLIMVAMDKGFRDDVYLFNQKILQLYFPHSEWMRLIKLAWEKGFYDVVISYIKKALPDDFPASYLTHKGFTNEDELGIIKYYVFASRRMVPSVDMDLYKKFLSYCDYKMWPIILEFGKFFGRSLDFDLAESWLDSGRFDAKKNTHYEFIGPHMFRWWDGLIENTIDNNGYGYIGLAELAKQNGRRDLCKKYIKRAEWLLNQYRKIFSDYDKNFVAETQRQIKILKA